MTAKSESPLGRALAEVNRQLLSYRAMRALKPEDFGHSPDGCWDGTDPQSGPAELMVVYEDASHPNKYRFRIFWMTHKHPWPETYWYCIGEASDSRGERTDRAKLFDIRRLPKKYIGRFKLDSLKCGRHQHAKILRRALEDGFDFAAHIAAENARADEECRAYLERQATIAALVIDDDDLPF